MIELEAVNNSWFSVYAKYCGTEGVLINQAKLGKLAEIVLCTIISFNLKQSVLVGFYLVYPFTN